MARVAHLRSFTNEELIFDAEETAIILKFIFKHKRSVVDELDINDRVREFAQGLLLEAVDSSYALGFVEALFRSAINPGAGVKRILIKFSTRAARHWFKHASSKDLANLKIYERVRDQLELNFGRILLMHARGIALNNVNNVGFVAYNSTNNDVVWG